MHMKKSLRIALLVVAAAIVTVGAGVLTACQEDFGDPVTKTLTIPDYAAINIIDAFEVKMLPGIAEPTITIDELLLDKVDIHVNDKGMLFIRLKNRINGSNVKQMKVTLPLNPSIVKVVVSGASSFDVEGATPLCDIEVDGASALRASNATDMQSIRLSGASAAQINGVGDEVFLNISGASALDAGKMLCSAVKGAVSGASVVDVTVCTKLDLDVSGASVVTYGLVSPTCTLESVCVVSGESVVTQRN